MRARARARSIAFFVSHPNHQGFLGLTREMTGLGFWALVRGTQDVRAVLGAYYAAEPSVVL